ncbi:TPA: LuxR family transcriptional regulator [Aeromonas bestiarum]|nr:LuxR family transcriptional regulator [Aeromonas bestiarum]HEH9406987.1 LuxR family transcriptional regulator [Aeromonas bestiarum]
MLINQLETATDQDCIIGLLRSLSQKLGFTQFRMIFIFPSSIQRPEVRIFNNCSAEWVKTYEKRHFFAVDPVVRKGMTQSTPILWAHIIEKCRAEEDQAGLEVMQQAQEAGLQDGITLPWHGAFGHVGLLSWITSSAHTKHQWLTIAPFLNWLAVHVFESLSRGCLYKHSSHEALSLREVEVCQWAAEGKQVSDIAKILDITPRTVTFHLNRVIEKLGASSKSQAISWVIKKGLVRLNIAAARIENVDSRGGTLGYM